MSTKISEHFTEEEFRCHCGQCEMMPISHALLQLLEKIRGNFGGPVTVTSGYRCPDHNRAVGGAPRSQHCQGIAADIKVYHPTGEQVSPRAVAEFVDDEYPDTYGVGIYPRWTHVDVRSVRARWASR